MKNNNLDKKLVINKEKCTRCGLCERTCWRASASQAIPFQEAYSARTR